MTADEAEILALRALTWIVAQEELLPVFLGSTGTSEDDMRMRAADPDFLGAVLDFLSLDDDWTLAFAAEAGVPPDAPMTARQALPGGGLPHWT